jgi:hypothetical protein
MVGLWGTKSDLSDLRDNFLRKKIAAREGAGPA